VVGEGDHAGVVGRVRGDEHARVVRARERGDDRAQVGGRQLAAAAGSVRERRQRRSVRGDHRHLSCRSVPERRAHSDAEIEAAIEALSDPARLDEAQRLVTARAPQLQRILDQALEAADWFGSAHQAEVLKAAGRPDTDERVEAVRTLIAEETRVSMLVGVAVGYELAQTLMKGDA
jgi:hypothetical protein